MKNRYLNILLSNSLCQKSNFIGLIIILIVSLPSIMWFCMWWGAYIFTEAIPNIKFISFYFDFSFIKVLRKRHFSNFFGKISFFKLFIFADVFHQFLRMKLGMFAGFLVSTTQKIFLKSVFLWYLGAVGNLFHFCKLVVF